MLARLRLLIALGAAGCATTSGTVHPALPTHLPAVTLSTLSGRPTQLATVLGGRPALVSLWATWCDSCAREFDALRRLDARARARGALVLAVDEGELPAKVARFARWRNLTYPQLADPQFRLGDALGVGRVPTTLVVDGQGAVVFIGGALDEGALRALQALLPGPL